MSASAVASAATETLRRERAQRMMGAPAQPYLLTKRQTELLVYIAGYIESHGIAPTYETMRRGIGATSKSGIRALLDRLETRNHIRRVPNMAQSIELLSKPSVPRAPDGAPCKFIPVARLGRTDPRR